MRIDTEQCSADSICSVAIPRDFNHDGTVDAADYVVWRNGLGTIYTQNDYDAWRAHFGQTAGSGAAGYPLGASAESLSAAVPEPSTFVLLLLTAAILLVISRGPSPAKNRS